MEYRVIKENDLFLLTDEKGNIPKDHPYGAGLYKKDTRFLSSFEMKINGEEPILLSSEAKKSYENEMILTNPHMEENGRLILWRESIELKRKRFIYEDVLYEQVVVKNYYPKPLTFQVSFTIDVDFEDMFLIRGFQSGEIGSRTGIKTGTHSMIYDYKGADNVMRSSVVSWDREAIEVKEGYVDFEFNLIHDEEQTLIFKVNPVIDGERGPVYSPDIAYRKLVTSYQSWNDKTTNVKTDYLPLQRMVDRGVSDLRLLLTDLGYGPFPVAGLPWFGVPFGRDSMIAALQMLSFNPDVAKGTLRTMAHYQGKNNDPWRDEQPGKIMHEIRYGELANTNQIPFAPYYGSVDSTPLFLVLLVEYVKWTNDLELANELLPNIHAALDWINLYGDRDGDGLVEYHQESSKGIANQGWKDSGDSIVHRNGDYAETPIALVEVQGYVYQAKLGLADLFDAMHDSQMAKELREQAASLKVTFHNAFWMEEHGYYAIALDKDKNQVGTLTSNPGHLLYSGILDEERIDSVSRMLTSEKMFSGFGVRTMADGEAGYNPMSYHDGSVWPHDNSMILLGMGKNDRLTEAFLIMNGLIEAAGNFEYDRLSELFCGYDHRLGKLIKYPVACSPQAWAAGTPLTFIQTLLGCFPDSLKGVLTLKPRLLEGMNELRVEQLRIGNGILSVSLNRTTNGKIELIVHENTTGLQMAVAETSLS
ncbi:amylo-alpha-1,6-glucosidase [Bacillus sp. RAR_GA_16]|uniref:amylo-alpha-1,6-glucosidase n=1 Tax=Bacillus sp. RAR_GA_16 TaxID=2876774 RepID=UPI001CCA3D01|nr:amylo-alpha-1,6-glucosidase [Bacillus sp. RAR_GA_16]MCA0172536.1 amylo-alpha-1,6-glucosidase [Bacillus sp. RAR_GA_16]